jgi:hypothetical protein
MLLMLKVAILTKSSLSLYAWVRFPKGATEFVVLAGIILPVERNGKPRTKTHGLVPEVAGLQSFAHLLLPSTTAYQICHTRGTQNLAQRTAISFVGD